MTASPPPSGLTAPAEVAPPPELACASLPVYLESLGERVALFGDPHQGFECWVWPIEVLRDLRLTLRRPGEDRAIEPDKLAINARRTPYGFELSLDARGLGLRWSVFAARKERALVQLFHYEGKKDLVLELSFRPIFRPQWPAGMGGQIVRRDPESGAVLLTEELGRYAVLFGSPEAEPVEVLEERGSDTRDHVLRLPLSAARAKRGPLPVFLVGAEVAAGELSESARLGGEQAACGLARASAALANARAAYTALGTRWPDLLEEERRHWSSLLERSVRLECPDPAFESAHLWSKIALESSWVEVDGLGRSYVAGVGASRGTARPGFAWFFGGDALAAARALCAVGETGSAAELLRFVASTQRADGKLMHELTLAARLCAWTQDYPYAYYKGQVTPGFVATLATYWRWTGDAELVRALWPTVLGCLRWCASTLDEEGRMRIERAGIAAVEAGPLAGRIASEVFLEGIHWSAVAGALELARALGLADGGLGLEQWEARCARAFEGFWSDSEGRYGFALLRDGSRCDDRTAYLGLPLSRGLGQPARAYASALELAAPDLCADWGARMFSTRSSLYAPEHYNIGSVFPYLTNFVTLALYRHGLDAQAFQLLESQVALCGFESPGLVPEHLLGDRAETPRYGVPHQAFSSGALLQSIVHGIFGLEPAKGGSELVLRTSLPPDWDRAALLGCRLGACRFDLVLERERGKEASHTRLAVRLREGQSFRLLWRPRFPALSLLPESASVAGASVALAGEALPSGVCEALFPACEVRGELELALAVVEGPSVRLPMEPLERGQPSRLLRRVDQRSESGRATWTFHGPAETSWRLAFHCDREIAVDGASFKRGELCIELPRNKESTASEGVTASVVLELARP